MMKFSVIIPSKERGHILEQSLDCISRCHSIGDIEVVIVNDADRPLQLPAKYSFAVVYDNEFGHGVAAARNFGASKASHDWLVFMDDDMLVQPETFKKLVYLVQDKKDSCFNINWVYPDKLIALRKTSPFLRYLHHYGFDSLEGWSRGLDWQPAQVFRVNGITSQFLVMHKEVFEKTGGYNQSFPFAGFEDHDFSKRLREAGIHVYLDPCNLIFHNEEDRIDVESWLERKKRGAITRRVAVSVGYSDLVLPYSLFKRVIYSTAFTMRKPLLRLLYKWPRQKSADRIFYLLVNIMLGTYSYTGYTSKQAQDFIGALNKK